MKIVVTGGLGFIGSHVVEKLVSLNHDVIIVDSVTYAADESLLENFVNENVKFYKVNIIDRDIVMNLFEHIGHVDGIIHLAAETHVDNSINDPSIFVKTNVLGTQNLLDAALKFNVTRFLHVSTDEVYGHLEMNEPKFTEKTPYNPRSPYSASKASSDLIVKSYVSTYGLNAVITNCSNNFGSRQHNEKLIPTVIRSLVNEQKIPVYGKGNNVRDWLFVEDHAEAIVRVFIEGNRGETYNIGGNRELSNLELIEKICTLYYEITDPGTLERLEIGDKVKFVEDRKGHDLRYAIDCSKIKGELGWVPSENFDQNLKDTVRWYAIKYNANFQGC